MKMSSKLLAAIVVAILFGGILFSSGMGWWKTESTKVPVAFSEGEWEGQYNPADIRGSYSFGEISKLFEIPLETLGEAFQINQGTELEAYQLKSLEEFYAGMPVEIGTSSVRLFVALYKGLPFELTENIYLLPQAVAILQQQGVLTEEQNAYLASHTADVSAVPATLPVENLAATTVATVAASDQTASGQIIKGSTTFQDLLDWGVAQSDIEAILGEPMPGAAVVIKDYATQKGLEFSVLKNPLQELLDNL